MLVSGNLALEIYTIIIFHVVALLFLFGFSFYIFLRAKKTPLLYSYLAVVAMIMLWMVSKILKTTAPDEDLRWLFIVTQYFGVEFMAPSLVVFAYIYTKDKIPSLKTMAMWLVLPLLSFAAVLTNPLHMGFYSYYDFYKDRFGPLFYPIQIIQYTYLLTGIVLLSKGYTNQPGFGGKAAWARFFAVVTLLPFLANAYYILFKMSVFPWALPFPAFDFTPIAGTAALILFMIPALKYRFFDISPISYRRLYAEMPQGIVFLDAKKTLYSGNSAFHSMFQHAGGAKTLQDFLKCLPFEKAGDVQKLCDFIQSSSTDFEILLYGRLTYRVTKKQLGNKNLMLCFTDITAITASLYKLEKQNVELTEANRSLDALAQTQKSFLLQE